MSDSQICILFLSALIFIPFLLQALDETYTKSCKKIMLKWRIKFRKQREKKEESEFKKMLREVR